MQEEIKKAIGAHGLWKGRLKNAIETGKSEFTVADVAADNKCEFGRWLYGVRDSAAPASGHYETIRGLHTEFHKEVAAILKQALAGKRDEALRAMEAGTPYSNCSAALTQEMMAWAKKAA